MAALGAVAGLGALVGLAPDDRADAPDDRADAPTTGYVAAEDRFVDAAQALAALAG